MLLLLNISDTMKTDKLKYVLAFIFLLCAFWCGVNFKRWYTINHRIEKMISLVYSSSPHQTQVVKDASEFIKVPKDLDPKYVIFFFNLMTTYNAILDARIKLGDVVVVSGLGLLGQLCAQMAKMSGAAKVYGIDTYSHRRQAAEENGCDETFDPLSGQDIALEIRKRTDNRGADVVLEVSGNTHALNEANSDCRAGNYCHRRKLVPIGGQRSLLGG